MSNPMTAAQDLIVGGSAGTPTRLAVGTPAQKLGVDLAGTLTYVGPERVPLFPSGDTTGATDDANMSQAIAALPNGGDIIVVAGATPFFTTAGWSPPAQTTSGVNGGGPVSLQGAGMPVLMPVGAGKTGILYHRTSAYPPRGTFGTVPVVGYVRDIVVDGSNATGASVGVDVGDAWGMDVRAFVQNFGGSGAVGANIMNRVTWTEKCRFEIHSQYNSTAVVIGGTAGGQSHEYCDYDVFMFAGQDQRGVVVQDGCSCSGCRFAIRGNMVQTSSATAGRPTNNVAALSVVGSTNSRIVYGDIYLKLEANRDPSLGGSVFPWTYYSDGSGFVRECTGIMANVGLSSINVHGAEFSFNGPHSRTIELPSASFPGLGNVWTNLGPDSVVCVAGGTITGIQVNGIPTGLRSGQFFVNGGGTIRVSGSVEPTTWTVYRATRIS
jgi:hypothetical protein